MKWLIRKDALRHAEGGTQVVLILETLGTFSLDAGKLAAEINKLPAKSIGLVELSGDQRGSLSSNLSGVLKQIF